MLSSSSVSSSVCNASKLKLAARCERSGRLVLLLLVLAVVFAKLGSSNEQFESIELSKMTITSSDDTFDDDVDDDADDDDDA